MRITVAQVEDLRRKLEQLPPQHSAKREVTKREAVALMADQVTKLQQRGYAMDEIANFLSRNGLTMSVQTLKSYLSRARHKAQAKQNHKAGPAKEASASRPPLQPKAPSMNGKRQTPRKAQGHNAENGSSTGVRSSGFMPREDSTFI